MRPLRIRSILTAAAGFAVLPIVGPLMLAMRSELEAALDRGDRAEAEADAASLRSDRDRQDLADTKSLWASANRLVAAQMAKAKADIDGLKALAIAANDRAEQATVSQRGTAEHLMKCTGMLDDRDASIRGLQNNLGVVSGERDAARKERDDLALRLAAETERCANVCESMIVGGRAWTYEQAETAEVLQAAARNIRGATVAPTEPDPVRNWPQPGVSDADACKWCGKAKGEMVDLCTVCERDPSFRWDDVEERVANRKALKSAAAAPKSST